MTAAKTGKMEKSMPAEEAATKHSLVIKTESACSASGVIKFILLLL